MGDTEIWRSEEAKRLLGSDFFAEALSEVKMDALLALAETDASSLTEMLRLQAIVRVVDEIKAMLEAAIIRTGERDGGQSMTATKDGKSSK